MDDKDNHDEVAVRHVNRVVCVLLLGNAHTLGRDDVSRSLKSNIQRAQTRHEAWWGWRASSSSVVRGSHRRNLIGIVLAARARVCRHADRCHGTGDDHQSPYAPHLSSHEHFTAPRWPSFYVAAPVAFPPP